MKLNFGCLALIGLLIAGFSSSARASAVSELEARKDLTPERFAQSFAGFKFELNATLQDAETFLQRKRGDCDDFASLASRILTERGYQTKLVVVMMAGESHVVCYVREAGGFLDYNHRADTHPIVESDGSLDDIAQKVAGDFRTRWQMVSEFKYQNRQPVYLDNVFPSAPQLARGTAPSLNTNSVTTLPAISSVVGSDKIARVETSRLH